MSSATEFTAFVRFNVCLAYEPHVLRGRLWFPWNSLLRNYLVCFTEFSTANSATGFTSCRLCVDINIETAFPSVGRQRCDCTRAKREMRNSLAIQETRSWMFPKVLQSLRRHDLAESLQQSDIVLVDFLLSLAFFLEFLQLRRDMAVLTWRIEVNHWPRGLDIPSMLVVALKLVWISQQFFLFSEHPACALNSTHSTLLSQRAKVNENFH